MAAHDLLASGRAKKHSKAPLRYGQWSEPEGSTTARTRFAEARTLLEARRPDSAYYLAGYAVECGLKACIAKKIQRHDFPDKKVVDASYTHNLRDLVKVANLEFGTLGGVEQRSRVPQPLGSCTAVVRAQPLQKIRSGRGRGLGRGDWRSETWSNGLDKTALVTSDVEVGSELIQALDHSELVIKVALWLDSSEYEDWRFVLASHA